MLDVIRPARQAASLSAKPFFLAIFLVALISCFFFIQPAQAFGADDEIAVLAKRYDMAKLYYNNLINRDELGKSRLNWDKAVGMFRKTYLARPKHELGLNSLFMMGRIYYEMYGRFKNPLDLGEAITYYQDVVMLFPKSSLADDALYILGKIYLEENKDRKRAANTFAGIMRRYPDGDMAAGAARELDALKDVVKEQEAFVPQAEEKNAKNSGKKATVLPVKFWSTDNYTRVVIQTTTPVDFKRQLLEKDGERPRRLYIDFKNSRMNPADRAPVPIQDGLLKQVRVGQFKPDVVRVVLDIESIAQYKVFTLQDPFRAVIDVKGQEKLDAEAAPVIVAEKTKKKPPAHDAPPVLTARKVKLMHSRIEEAAPQKVAATEQLPVSLARQLGLGIKRIVLDPGHGGKDPGAIAKNGLKEKDVALRVAKKLAIELERSLGCEVLFTRTSDVFIPLEERTAIANTSHGDIFISLHVNSAPTPRAKGVETYLLDLTTDEDAMRLAAFENATSTSKMSDLQNILSDLLNNNRKDESTRLAQYVQTNMVQGLKLRNLGVKQAPFYVLIGAQMPAILSEITFLSDPKEAERLKQDDYLDVIAQQIAAGIGDYVADSSVASLN